MAMIAHDSLIEKLREVEVDVMKTISSDTNNRTFGMCNSYGMGYTCRRAYHVGTVHMNLVRLAGIK